MREVTLLAVITDIRVSLTKEICISKYLFDVC